MTRRSTAGVRERSAHSPPRIGFPRPLIKDQMTATAKKTGEVLAAARKDLEAQLVVVREEMGRLAAEELALTSALSSLNGDSTSSPSAPRAGRAGGQGGTAQGSTRRSSARKAPRRRRPRGASKSTAERVKELEGLLADGPKSRTDLAAALKVSPARVQQLLAELGGSVSSQRDPGQRQGKLWTLKAGSAKGASAAEVPPRPAKGRAKRSSARKPAAAKAAAK